MVSGGKETLSEWFGNSICPEGASDCLQSDRCTVCVRASMYDKIKMVNVLVQSPDPPNKFARASEKKCTYGIDPI